MSADFLTQTNLNRSLTQASAKQKFREESLQRLQNMTEVERSEKSAKIQKNIEQLFEELQKTGQLRPARSYCASFSPLKNEPNLQGLQFTHIEFCYPQTLESSQMRFISEVKEWKKSHWGVLEPLSGVEIALREIEVALIPALAFNTSGYRLGRGAGYYDHTFQGFTGCKVGVCFDFSLTSDVPFEHGDIKMNYVVTDRQILKVADLENECS